MFENLIESKRKRQKSVGEIAFSLLIHGAIGYGAIAASGKVAAEVKGIVQQDIDFATAPPPPPPPEIEVPKNVVVTETPPLKGFQTVMPPKDIPDKIPEINLNEKFNKADFSGKGEVGGVAAGVEGGTPVTVDEVYEASQVEENVDIVEEFPIKFPPVLRAAGITGEVTAQWIVGLDGKPEEKSIKILKSANKGFEAPTKEAIMKTKYKPAKIGGKPVRVWVQRTFKFQ